MDNKMSIVLDSSENSNDSIQLISDDSHDHNGNPKDSSKIQQTIPTNSLGTSNAIVAKDDLTFSDKSDDSVQLISDDSHDNNGNPSDTSKIQQTIPTNSLGTSNAIVAKNDLTSSDKSDDSIVAVSATKIGCEVAPIKYIAVKPMITKKSAETNMFHEDDEDDMWKNLPSTQQLVKTAITPKPPRDQLMKTVIKKEPRCEDPPIKYTAVKPMITKKSAETNMFREDDEDDMWKNLPSTQQLVKTAVTPKPPREQLMKTVIKKEPKLQEHLNDVDDNFCYNIPPTQEPFKSAIKLKPKSSTTYVAKTPRVVKVKNRKLKNSPRTKVIKPWLKCKKKYEMSDALFEEVFDPKTNKVNRTKFLYRKDSIAMEIDKLFPGCVIYIRRPAYEGKKCWVLRAYCAHLKCRRYTLRAYYTNPKTFSIECNQPKQIHTQTLARQIRRFERDEMQEKLLREFPDALRRKDIKNANDASVVKGNMEGIASLCVYQEVRREALAKQDKDTNDIEDVAAMKTDDANTNFISDILPSHKYAVYLHAKNQQDALNKLHKIRAENGKPIVARLDASGDVARDVPAGKLLYHALTVNFFVDNDKKSTALPITEQYNTCNTSKDIAKWLFDFELSHAQWYENHPLLFDVIVSDFSYANFHAILKAFNSMCLANFLNAAYNWITVLQATGKFPDEYTKLVKIRMCYTHLMKTFADMCRRLFGKTTDGKQLPQSKIVLEILGSLIKASDYRVILQLWKQLVILLNTEFANADVHDALVMVKKITTSIDLEDYSNDKLTDVIDIDDLPEKDDTLYENNLFFIQFATYTNPNYFDNNPKKHMEKNIYYSPSFLEKFLKRFVPLIPFWTNVLAKPDDSILSNIESVQSISKMTVESCINRNIHLLEVSNNQPLETYFGKFKRELLQNAVHLGQPPIKLGRAITFSRGIIDSTIKSLNFGIKKSQCNTQKPRKQYEKKPKPPLETQIPVENLADTEIPAETDLHGENLTNIEVNIDSENLAETALEGENVAGVGINLRKRKPVPKKYWNMINSTDIPGEKLSKKTISRKVKRINTSTFKESKENYNKKRSMKKFSYFKGNSIAKVDSVDSSTIYENSLYKNVSVYYNISDNFVIASNNNDSYLSNHDFDLLHRKEELSPALMKYVTCCYPDNVQVLILSNKDVGNIKLLQNTVFVLIYINYWVLFIIDKTKKSIYLLNPKQPNTESDFRQIFSQLKLPKSYKEKSFPIHTVKNEIYNTGIYIYAYMMQYITKGTVSKNRIYGNSIRLDLENKIIKKSNDMTESCLICGSESDHPLAFGWTQCTNCDRWMHCYCANIDFDDAQLDDNLKCCVCSYSKSPESS